MAEFQRCAECEKPQSESERPTTNSVASIKTKSSKCNPNFMADGRSFGDIMYKSRCTSQYQPQIDNNFQSSFEYRQYLIQNAEKIMQENSRVALRFT